MRKGFSLIELSIVLVILGLLVGGILAGKSLIRAAELRSLSSDITKVQTAVAAFRDKYFAFPGDMSNATAFWGKDAVNCNGQTGTAATPGTCNGYGTGAWGNGSNVDQYLTWQHLAYAGLWPGSWPGIASIAPGQTVAGDNPGVNLPTGPLTGPNGPIVYKFRTNSNTRWNNSNSFSALYIGVVLNACCGGPFIEGGGLIPEEMWNIDTKLDDGLPGFGKMQADFPYYYRCATTNVASTAVYSLSGSGSCSVTFDIGLNR